MSTRSSKILVVGGTGVIGKVLFNALLNARAEFARIALFTSTETARSKADLLESFRSRGAEILTGDLYNDADVLEAYNGFDTVVSAVGRFGIDKQVDLVRLAEQSGTIVRFIPSEYGTDVAYDASSADEKPHQKKLKVRAYLESEAVQRIRYTYLVTGSFASLYAGYMETDPDMGTFNVATRSAVLLGDGDGPLGLTTLADVGRALVCILRHPEVCDNRAIKVSSFVTTPHAILAEYERQTESKWTVKYTPLDTLRQRETEAWETEKPLAPIYTLRRIWTEGKTLYDHLDNEDIGLHKTDTLEMVVQEGIWKPSAGFQSGKL